MAPLGSTGRLIPSDGLEDLINCGGVPRRQGFGLDVALHPERDEEAQCRLAGWHVEDADDVVAAHRPPDVDLAAPLGRRLLGRLCPLGRLPDVLDALLGPVPENHELRHCPPSFHVVEEIPEPYSAPLAPTRGPARALVK